ncbi:hypothetical protein Tco_0966288 [Tanacetum coccineum]
MAALQYKDDHNKIAYLGRESGSEDFTDILSYLDHSTLRYALTHDPSVVFDSLVKQFWATATVRPNAAGSHDLVATIDGREVVVTESLIRAQLQLDDANGIFDMQIDDILEGMWVIGYPTGRTLTFLKHHLSPQWRFLVHTLMHCLSPKSGSWNQFPSSIATTLICLSTDRMLADEEIAAAHEAAGSTAETHPEPHSPPVSPVREPTPERQPETEWVVPNPVSPVTDWRPWPSVPAHSPIRDPTPEPASPPSPPAQTFMFEEPLVFGPAPRPAGDVDPDVIESIIFGPQPRPHGYVDRLYDTTHGGFHVESPVRPNDASTPTADAAGRAEDPVLLTSLSAKLDRCMGRLDSLETELGTTKKIMGGAILTLVSRVKKLEKMVKQLRTTRLVGDVPAAEGDVDIQDDVDLDGLSRLASAALGHDQPAVPSADVEEREEEEVPLRRKRSAYRRARTEFSTPAFEQFQATLSADDLPHTAVSESAGLSGAADKGKAPLPELDIPAEFVAEDAQARKRLEEEQASERLVQSLRAEDLAQEDLPNVSEERAKELDDLMMRMTETDWLTLMMQVGSNPALARELLGADGEVYELAWAFIVEQGWDLSKLEVLAKQASTSGGIHDFFLESDEEEQIGMSRVAADPDSDDEVLAEIIFRGKSISGDGVVLVDKLPDDEIVDPRVKVETVSDYASSPPRNRRKHLGVRSDDCLWDKPVEDFFSSESESDDDMENYIPPLPYGEFKDWEMVSCPPGNSYIHVYYQQNRRRKYFTYLKQLLPHVYREDILLLRRRMNRYFRLNPDVNIGLDLWRDVNMLCQSLHSDDVEDFWSTQDEWIVCSWKLYPKSSVHVLDLTNGKTVYMFVDKFYPIRATLLERMLRHRLTVPPSYCRDVVVAGNIIRTVQDGLRQAYECLASAPIACTARQMVFSSPWLTAKKESGSSLQTALVCNSNPLIALASPEQTATGKDVSNPLYGCDGLPKTVRVFQFTLDSRSEKLDWLLLHQDWKLLFCDVAALFDSAVHRVHAVSIDAVVASTVSAACIVAAGYLVSAGFMMLLLTFSSSVPADYVPAGHVLISADRYREYADLNYRLLVTLSNQRPWDCQDGFVLLADSGMWGLPGTVRVYDQVYINTAMSRLGLFDSPKKNKYCQQLFDTKVKRNNSSTTTRANCLKKRNYQEFVEGLRIWNVYDVDVDMTVGADLVFLTSYGDIRLSILWLMVVLQFDVGGIRKKRVRLELPLLYSMSLIENEILSRDAQRPLDCQDGFVLLAASSMWGLPGLTGLRVKGSNSVRLRTSNVSPLGLTM